MPRGRGLPLRQIARESRPEVRTALRARPSFAEVVRVVEEIKGERWVNFRERRGDWGRELALYLGRELAGLSLAELQGEVEVGTAMAISSSIGRFAERLREEKPLRKLLARTLGQLRDG